MEPLERRKTQLELDTPWDAKPVKAIDPAARACLMRLCFFAPSSNRSAVFSTDCSRSKQWNPGQQAVTVVNSRDNKTVDYCLPDVHWQGPYTALYPAQLQEAPAD